MKSTFSVMFYIQGTRTNKNGKTPIFGRITVNGKSVTFSTKEEINPAKWSATDGKPKGRTAEDKKVNEVLEGLRLSIRSKYYQLINEGEILSAELLKHSLFSTESSNKIPFLLQAFDVFNAKQEQKVPDRLSEKHYKRYLSTRRRLEEFILLKYRQTDIHFKSISTNFLDDFKEYLTATYDLHPNTVSKNLQRLRTVFLFCQKNRWTDYDPFCDFVISFKHTHREHLTQEEINKLLKSKIPNDKLERTRDIFLFVVYTGLSYCDLAKMKTDDIYRGNNGGLWISNKRLKTGIHFEVPLLNVPLSLLKKYEKFQRQNNGRLLPVPTNQELNRNLKDIALRYGINKKLHMHLGRHTFASTIALENGVSIESLAKMLGHTNIRTTQIYAKVSQVKLSNEMQLAAERMNQRTAAITI